MPLPSARKFGLELAPINPGTETLVPLRVTVHVCKAVAGKQLLLISGFGEAEVSATLVREPLIRGLQLIAGVSGGGFAIVTVSGVVLCQWVEPTAVA